MLAYLVTNRVTGSKYIGITKFSLRERWSGHRSYARSSGPSTPIARALKKYGEAAFRIEAIACSKDYESLKLVEQVLIAQHATHVSEGGYNVTRGGDGALGRPVSEETRKKHSEAGKRQTANPDARAAMSRLATIQWESPILRKQQSLRHKGKVISDAQRLKLSVAGRGRVVGAETRAKIAAALRGKSRPEHVIAAVRAAQTGKKHSTETRMKMSLSKKGIPKSEAHKRAIRESLIRLAVERRRVPT